MIGIFTRLTLSDFSVGRRKPLCRAVLCLLSAVLMITMNACVERSLTLRSEPVGAAVVVNGSDVGLAPVTVEFDTYGVYEVVMDYPQHHRLRETVPVSPPWYETFPLDFLVENIWPFTVRDCHEITLELKPLVSSDDEGIAERERLMRARMETGDPLPEKGQ